MASHQYDRFRTFPPPSQQPPSLPVVNASSHRHGTMGSYGDPGPSTMRTSPIHADRKYHRRISSPLHSDPGGQDALSKVKRAKSAQKITRNRKITSCLQCRERKQKCDRQRPVCSNCMVGNSRGGMCTYVDTPEAVQEVLANEGEKDAKRVKRSPSEEAPSLLYMPGPARPMLPVRSPLTVRRLNLIAATARAGRDRSLDFEVRVRYARAAAMGMVLFGTPPSAGETPQVYQPLAAVDSLKLPTAAEIGPLLDTYRRHVEWMCNVVLVDLNRARFESFLNWWHSNPQTLPADPPLIPLVLTILALAIQARRMAPHCTLDRKSSSSTSSSSSSTTADKPNAARRETSRRSVQSQQDRHGIVRDNTPSGRAQSPRDPYVTSCSSEKELLETAQRCIDVLQITCPSNWASAFSAPLDLVRASLLRGLWHMTELHLQFAGSCFAATTRLAHAASLNHDTKHWPSMGKEESQARRNIFWNMATFEIMFSMRVVQPSMILASSYDTSFPDDYDALMNLYRYGGLIEPYVVAGRRSHFRVMPVSKPSFDFHLARFQLTDILIKGQELLRTGNKGPLAEAHEQWQQELPAEVRQTLEQGQSGALCGGASGTDREVETGLSETELDDETHYLQASLLQMMNLCTMIQVHRPQADETGRWRAPDGQAQRSLEKCIDSAQRLIWLVHAIVTRNPGPPFVMFHQCVFHCFQAAIVIAIQSALSTMPGPRKGACSFAKLARPSLDKALQTLDSIAQQDSLRYVAEQAGRYASTLREIDAAQHVHVRRQENENEVPRSPAQNVQRSGLGVPALAVAEGDGKMLGGQGYPIGEGGEKAASVSPQSGFGATRPVDNTGGRDGWGKTPVGRPPQPMLPELLAFQAPLNTGMPFARAVGNQHNGDGVSPSIPSMQTMLPQSSFGIDFSDLQVFGPDSHARFDAISDDTFMDRPMSSSSFGNLVSQQNMPASGGSLMHSNAHSSATGLDLLAASVLPERSTGDLTLQQQHQQQQQQDVWRANGNGEPWSDPTVQPDGLRSTRPREMPPIGADQGTSDSSSSWRSPLQRDQLLVSSSKPVDVFDTSASTGPATGNGDGLAPQPASAPALESLGDTFATDWSEWERAVERLLYTER